MSLLTIRRRHPSPTLAPAWASPARLPAPARPSVVDSIAPHVAERDRDYLRLDDTCAGGLAITEMPLSIVAGQLLPACAICLPFDLTFLVHPIARAEARRFLQAQATRHGAAQSVATSRLGDPTRDLALGQAQSLRADLERGHEDLFHVSIAAVVRATSPAALRRLEDQLAELLAALGLASRRTVLQQLQAFRSVLPQLTPELDERHYFTTSSLAALLPWRAPSLWLPGGALWGLTQANTSPVGINLFANPPLRDANCVVFARVRQGKSFLLKLLIRRFLLSDPASGAAGADHTTHHRGGRVVVVDAEQLQEYRPLCEDLDGQYIRLTPGGSVHLNPFDLPPYDPDDDELADPRRAHIATLLRFLELLLADRGQHLSADERAICDLALTVTYDQARADGRTPLLRDLLTVLRHPRECLPEVDYRLVRSLATRLARWVDGSLGALFAQPTDVTLTNPLAVFNVSALDESLRPIGIFLIEQFVWNQQRRQHVAGEDEPCLLVVDELWLTLRTPEGGAFLDAMARKGPKYWFGLVVASQQPEDCLASSFGQAIVDNASTRVLLHMDAGALRTAAEAFSLTRPEIAALESAGAGEALLLCAGERQLISLLASDKEKDLFSTTPAELAARNRQQRQAAPLARAGTWTRTSVSDDVAAKVPPGRRSALFADLFDDLDPDPDTPVPLSLFQRRSMP
jgi:type IV secretory pathway VirB4 component